MLYQLIRKKSGEPPCPDRVCSLAWLRVTAGDFRGAQRRWGGREAVTKGSAMTLGRRGGGGAREAWRRRHGAGGEAAAKGGGGEGR